MKVVDRQLHKKPDSQALETLVLLLDCLAKP